MADTTYVDNTTPAVAADWLNDLNRLHYTIFGDPADDAAARTGIGVAAASAQEVYTQYTAFASGATAIALDDTIPQNTEGVEFMTQAITPKSATNILVIDVLWNGALDSVETIIGALFQDSTANALAACWTPSVTANGTNQLRLRYTMVAGTTSATTFKFRVGYGPSPSGKTIQMNGSSGARYLGGALTSSIRITEYNA